jgi:hypothetical protein
MSAQLCAQTFRTKVYVRASVLKSQSNWRCEKAGLATAALVASHRPVLLRDAPPVISQQIHGRVHRRPHRAAVSPDTNLVSVLRGSGDGTFTTRQDWATGAGPAAFALGDLNGDRRLASDVATAVSVVLNACH